MSITLSLPLSLAARAARLRICSKAAGLAGALAFAGLCGAAPDENMTLVKGRFATPRVPEEAALHSVHNGEPVLHSKVKVGKDGSFGFYFQPEAAGLYTVGDRTATARLYLTPGRTVQVTLDDGTFTVGEGDKENARLAEWSKTIWELKQCNQMRGLHTYKTVFPKLPELERAVARTQAGSKTGNAAFDALFAKLVPAEFEYELYHFLFMPRPEHPKQEDYPDVYRKVSSGPHFTDTSVLDLDFGMSLVNTYLMFQLTTHKAEFDGVADAMAENCLRNVQNGTVKGWYLARNILTRARGYDDAYTVKLDKYRKFLVTDEQRKLVADFVLTINQTAKGEPAMPFEGTTPDGKKVSLADCKGKVVLVDVWATWCGPCRAQIPSLKKLEEELHGKDVVFLSYSIDESKDTEKWKKMIADEKLGGVQLIGDAAFKSPICTSYKITSIPRFMVFDKRGNIVSIDAPRPSTPELKPLLENLLK